MQTPFFPAWRAHLAALGRRSAHNLRQSTLAQLSQRLAGVIPPHLLRAPPAGDHSRERIYSLRLTCECFIWQMLNPQTACREVVRQVQALARLEGCRAVAEGTSAYVQARQRLPLQRLKQVFQATASATERRAGRSRVLQNRPVKVIDGSTVQLPDTACNQRVYPQPSRQQSGCGFPVMKLAVLFSLASGALLEVVMGNLHCHDL